MNIQSRQTSVITDKSVMRPHRFVLTGNENHRITLEEASTLTRNYRESHTQGCALGGYFGGQIFTKILSQEACVGIRIYLAQTEGRDSTFVLVGAEANGNDLFQGILGANPVMCTDSFSQLNELNSTPEERIKNSSEQSQVFSGDESHYTTLAEAGQLTRNYRETRIRDIGKGGFFGRNIFEKILPQSDCVGIRIYYALHDNAKPTFVLVGVDQYGNDLVDGVLGEEVMWCPPYCFAINPVNS